eukprot:TRINITY_DN940_c0_g3_i3.p1 TRINITY_DN940_c0_g3~~TRINITY_DN940_c0_g3_i3.p1  ORF type:complete len:213 (-),score=23.94 TRINITY_DN940_c0_g3_i3:48-686(-)
MKWAYQQLSNSRYSFLYSSHEMCYNWEANAHDEDDVSFKAYFRRIHYMPSSLVSDLWRSKEAISQGVIFSEMEYPPVIQFDTIRVLTVIIEEEAISWTLSAPDFSELIVRIVTLLGAIVAIPAALKRVAQRFVTEVTGTQQKIIKIIFAILPFLALAVVICLMWQLHPEYHSSELFNILWLLVIFSASFCLIIIIQMFWQCLQEKDKFTTVQ